MLNKEQKIKNKTQNIYKTVGSLKKQNKIIMRIIIKIIMMTFILIYINTKISFAASPKMVNKIYESFNKIQKYITRISTPIAGVAFGTGLLMRKFSFGDEERVRKSKKLIRDTAVAYSLILCLDLILSFIETLAG